MIGSADAGFFALDMTSDIKEKRELTKKNVKPSQTKNFPKRKLRWASP
jgi:hypothetical protein